MPSFLRSLGRKSSRMSKSGDRHNNATVPHNANGLKHRASASTLNSSQVGSSTPSTTPATSTTDEVNTQTKDVTNGPTPVPPVPSRPQRPTTEPVKRYSMNGLASPISNGSNGSNSSFSRLSLFAPRVLSVSDNSWVHQQVLLVFGQIGEAQSKPLDGTLTVNHHQGRFPSTCWPVQDSYFKALVHLESGWNRIRLDFTSPKISSPSTSMSAHASFININYLPLSHSPPLQLAIILGHDSPGTYDAPPERIEREGMASNWR
ncbi:hypothetical protein P3342_011941 [Pyrenophora teres f. teres]|nr:hypothetical protein P3342_011941 [Pyrenophora teres f. teres]